LGFKLNNVFLLTPPCLLDKCKQWLLLGHLEHPCLLQLRVLQLILIIIWPSLIFSKVFSSMQATEFLTSYKLYIN
jgi:hypothetical protein